MEYLNRAEQFLIKHKKITIPLGIVLVLILFFYYFLIEPSLFLYAETKVIPLKLRPIRNAFDRQDLATLKFELEYFRSDLEKINNSASKIGIFSVVPWAGGYASDLKNVAGAGMKSYDAVIELLGALIPNLPQINFSGWASDAPASPENSKISQLVQALPSVSGEFPKFKERVEVIKEQINKIDEKRYPVNFRGKNIRSLISQLKQGLNELSFYFDDIGKALEAAPQIIGMSQPGSYLVIIQNDKELRPAGGLLAGFAALTIDKGNFKLVRSGDVFFLDEKINRSRPQAPSFISRAYGNQSLYIKDANYSPDFKTSAQAINDIWQTLPGNNTLDGVAVIDTQFLKSLLRTLGEVKISPTQSVNVDNADATLQNFFKYTGSRAAESRQYKDLTSFILNELLKKAFAGSAKNYPALGKSILELGKSKHFQVYFKDGGLQNLAEKLDLAGRVKDFNGDYLNINLGSYSNQRLDDVLSEQVNKTGQVNGDGTLTSNLEIKFNLKPEGFIPGTPDVSYYVRVYVPKGSTLNESGGFTQAPSTSEDLGKTVFAGLINLKLDQESNITIKYTSPKMPDGGYSVLIQKQPGTDNPKYKISLGDKSQEFDLTQDKEIKF